MVEEAANKFENQSIVWPKWSDYFEKIGCEPVRFAKLAIELSEKNILERKKILNSFDYSYGEYVKKYGLNAVEALKELFQNKPTESLPLKEICRSALKNYEKNKIVKKFTEPDSEVIKGVQEYLKSNSVKINL